MQDARHRDAVFLDEVVDRVLANEVPSVAGWRIVPSMTKSREPRQMFEAIADESFVHRGLSRSPRLLAVEQDLLDVGSSFVGEDQP